MKFIKQHLFVVLNLCIIASFGQTKTISDKGKNEREDPSLHKVMIIPFEPRLYLSEIDHNINAETKLTGKEIKYKFRDGINEQLFKAFKSAKYNVVDLMEDTAKYRKDTEGIYQYLTYEYQKIPDQANYQPPKKEKEEKKIEKGQLNIETDLESRFMNAKMPNSKVFPALNGKYKTDVFVFINELEIKASGNKSPSDLGGSGNSNRRIVVHYTVYTKDYKEINSGTAETDFEPSLNNPKKIIDKYFAKVATQIVERTTKGLNPVTK